MKTLIRYTARLIKIVLATAFIIINTANAATNMQTFTAQKSSIIDEIKKNFPNLNNELILSLITDGHIRRYYSKDQVAQLKPAIVVNSNESTHLPISALTNINIEEVYYLSVPNLHIPEDAKPNNPQLVKLYNSLKEVSKLSGLEYYSASRKKMRTLFETAYAVESAAHPVRISDPVVTTTPHLSELVIFQKDLTFGENLVKSTYLNTGNQITLSLTNLDDLRYGIFRIVKKNHMLTMLTIMPINDGLLIYCNMSADTLNVPGFEKTQLESFGYRLDALANWTKNKIKNIIF